MDLDKTLANIQKQHKEQLFNKLQKRIYSLDLPSSFLSTISQNELIFIHVKLHNALSYKKPFADIKNIKKVHDELINYLDNHISIDSLDEK